MKNLFLISILSLTLLGCNSEIRTYKRVGGNHLHLKTGNKELFWFSGIHGYNPENPMFRDIKEEFNSFKPDIVLVEGHFNDERFEDEISAIKSGESAYVSYLAMQNKLPCSDVEPPDSNLNKYLISKYGKRNVLTMYLIRQMIQWSRSPKNMDFEEIIIAYVKWEDENIGYFNDEITLDKISLLLEPHTNTDKIDNSNWLTFDAKKYLYFSENEISRVYNETLNYRNIYLVDLIENKKSEYDRIFIMMGFDHAKEVNESLAKIYKNKTD